MKNPTAFREEASYISLFPNTTFNNIDEVHSIYGPGAYFITLMNLVKKRIAPDKAALALKTRRPDLSTLDVTAAASQEAQPYLAKVLELLEGYLKKNGLAKVWQNRSQADTNFLPYHKAMADIETGLKSLHSSWEKLIPYVGLQQKGWLHSRADWVHTSLGLTPEDLKALHTDFPTVINAPELLMAQANITEEQLEALIYNQLPKAGRTDEALKKLFINQGTGPIRYQFLKEEEKTGSFQNLTLKGQNRIRAFLIIARAIGWAYPTVDAVLTKLGISDFESDATKLDAQLEKILLTQLLAQAWQCTPQAIIEMVQSAKAGTPKNIDLSKPITQVNAAGRKLLLLMATKANMNPHLFTAILFNGGQSEVSLAALYEIIQLQKLLTDAGFKGTDLFPIFANYQHFDPKDKAFQIWCKNFKSQLTQFDPLFPANGPAPSSNGNGKSNGSSNGNGTPLLPGDHSTTKNGGSTSTLVKGTSIFQGIEKNILQTIELSQVIKSLEKLLGLTEEHVSHFLHGVNEALLKKGQKDLAAQLSNWAEPANKYTALAQFVNQLNLHVFTYQQLGLSKAQIEWLGQEMTQEDGTLKPMDLDTLFVLVELSALKQNIQTHQQDDFVQFLKNGSFGKSAFTNNCQKIFSWRKGAVVNYFSAFPDDLKPSNALEAISFLHKMQEYFGIRHLTGISVGTLLGLVKARIGNTAYSKFNPINNKLQKVVKDQMALQGADFKTHHRQLLGQQLEQQRDQILPLVISKLGEQFSDLNTPDHVSDYFLCDVSMSGKMDITPVREALDAVQSYLMRCKNQLEQAQFTQAISKKDWEWIPNFRVWQAEQKLRYHPEHYLQADVRSTTTEIFEQFKNNLHQQPVNEDNVLDAFRKYLDDWEGVSQVDVVDAGCFEVWNEAKQKKVETLFLFAKSKLKAGDFSFIQCTTDTDGKDHWTQWKNIPVQIPAGNINGVYAFNRLYIFWTEQSSVTDTDPTVDKGKFTVHTNTIKFIYQKHSGQWTTPQTFKSFPFYLEPSNTNSKLALKNDAMRKLLQPNQVHWKKLGLTTVMHEGNELLLLSHGPLYDPRNFNHDIDIIEFPPEVQQLKNDHLQTFLQFTSTLVEQWKIFTDAYRISSEENVRGVFQKIEAGSETDFEGQYLGIESFECPADHSNFSFVLKKGGISKRFTFSMESDPWKADFPDGVFIKAFTYKNKDYLIVCRRKQVGYYLFQIDFKKAELTLLKQVKVSHGITDIQLNYRKSDQSLQFLLSLGDATVVNELIVNGKSVEITTPTNAKENPDYRESPTLLRSGFRPAAHQFLLPLDFLNYNNEPVHCSAYNEFDSIFFGAVDPPVIGMPINHGSDTWMAGLAKQDSFHLANYAGLINQDLKNGSESNYFKSEIQRHANFRFFAVRNLDQAFYFTNGDRHYLFNADLKATSRHSLNIQTGRNSDLKVATGVSSYHGNVEQKKLKVTRIRSKAAHNISHQIKGYGVEGILSRQVQQENSQNGHSHFSDIQAIAEKVESPKVNNDGQVEFTGPNGIYSRELFFHAPMLVAHLYTKNLQFDKARQWLQYVFQPLASDQNGQGNPGVWNYLPFHNSKTAAPEHHSDVFDPDLIAEADPAVYMRWAVRQYIQNLIEWGDHEFRQETWASLSAATQLYFEAEDVLGQLPKSVDGFEALKTTTFTAVGENIDDFFKVPTDIQLKSLWSTIKDRLYKLRHGLNINGERQMPAAFASMISPKGLLAATRNGHLSAKQNPEAKGFIPNYRFRDLFPHAQTMVEMVIQFGSQLYSALQQKDNQQLEIIHATQHQFFEKSVEESLKNQLAVSQSELNGLKQNLLSVTSDRDHYQKLISNGLSTREIIHATALTTATELQFVATALQAEAPLAFFLPNIFGMSNGGMNYGKAVESGAQALHGAAGIFQNIGQAALTGDGYERRREGWVHQVKQLDFQLKQIQSSIDAATARVKIAKENLAQHQLAVSQAKEVLSYLQTKFTNLDLSNWMASQMTSLYFSAYQIALSNLHKLAKAYEFEVGTKAENFIPSNSWNSLHKGLLAGETLKLGLAKLHDSYLTNNTRGMEIEKIFSLKALKSDDWSNFQSEGNLTNIAIGQEQLIGPHPYHRLAIKSVSVSIPAVLGPYQTFDAILRQTSNKINSSTNDQHYPKKQEIMISKGIDDMGIFLSDANDGRYLPFEGTGAVSIWEFTMAKELAAKVSDIILTIKFTAK